jgi:hypothetical protein
MSPVRIVIAATFAAGALVACKGRDDSNVVRGKGLEVASFDPATAARVYEAAARGSFDVDNTSLLLDRRRLPLGIGLDDGGPLDSAVVSEMQTRGTVKGVCEPPLEGTVGAPKCTAEYPGYVVRFSTIFSLGKPDSVQVYIFSQKYDTPKSGNNDRLRFERAYQIVRTGDSWRAVREGYVPKEARGEK